MLTFITLLFSSCSKEENKIGSFDISEIPQDELYSEPGKFPFVRDDLNVSLTIAVDNPKLISSFENNSFTKYIEDNANIEIEWLVWDSSSSRDKLISSLESNEYPDVFLGLSILNSDIEKYGVEQQKFIPINDLINSETMILKNLLSENKEYIDVISASDKKIYSVPTLDENKPLVYGSKVWINNNWLEELELETPETVDQFYNVLKAFKTKDPNVNGKEDEIPFIFGKSQHSSLNFILNAFFFTNFEFSNYNFLSLDDERNVVSDISRLGYKEALKYLNILSKENLIYDESFNLSSNAMKNIFNIDPNVVGAFASSNPIDVLPSYESLDDYTLLPPLTGESNHASTAVFPDYPTTGSFLITDKCEHPVVAIKLADYLLSPEGTLNNLFGIENEGWKESDEDDIAINGSHATWERNQSTVNDVGANRWLRGPYWFDNELKEHETNYGNITNGKIRNSMDLEKYLYDGTATLYEPYGKDFEKYVLPPIKFTSSESTELQAIWSELAQYISDMSRYFIEESNNIDGEWGEYINKLSDLGLDRYIELYQIAYDRQYSK